MITIDPSTVSTRELHQMMLGAVAPRPIALASTIDTEGNPNVSPFSFFNIFSANPPILIFSPSRRVIDNTTKDTLSNALETKEVVINIVNYDMVQQMSLSSTAYPKGVNEFEKAGFTMLASQNVKPYRVAESPVHIECKVNSVIPMGTQGGAGNLILCEIVLMHFKKDILNTDYTLDSYQIDLVARMGGNWYTRAREGMFEVEKPLTKMGIGVDALPKEIRKSIVLTGNDLGKLANVAHLPKKEDAKLFLETHPEIKQKIHQDNPIEIHKFAQQYLDQNEVDIAWHILVANNL